MYRPHRVPCTARKSPCLTIASEAPIHAENMAGFLKTLFGKTPPQAARRKACVPEGMRVYAIGDVHGRLDLLREMSRAIEEREAELSAAETLVILLGDLVDRGPDSAGVLRFARDWQARANVRILAGNHEEMFLKSFENADILRHFLRHGGKETLLSFGMSWSAYASATVEKVREMMAEVVPAEDRAFIEGLEDKIALGDYLFVHAGIEPDTPIEDQKTADLRWIREPFLSHAQPHEALVVHGHTITDEPVDNDIRIGVDTGAYASGRLTALVLEGSDRAFFEAARGEDGSFATRLYPTHS